MKWLRVVSLHHELIQVTSRQVIHNYAVASHVGELLLKTHDMWAVFTFLEYLNFFSDLGSGMFTQVSGRDDFNGEAFLS